MSVASVLASILGAVTGSQSSVASLRASVFEKSAAFYKLAARLDAQDKTLSGLQSLRGNTMSAADAGKLLVAQRTVFAAKNQWASTNVLLSNVLANLQAASTNPTTAVVGSLLVQVPQVVAAMATSQQLVDANDRLIAQLTSGLSSAEQAQLAGGGGLPIGLLVGVGALGLGIYAMNNRGRSSRRH